ncbi:hypothetical protein D3C81_2224920 [compost metagenome]
MHPNRRFDTGFQFHLFKQVLHVNFHRAFGDIEAAGNHLIRQTLGDEFKDIALAWCQQVNVAVRRGAVGTQAGGQHWR